MTEAEEGVVVIDVEDDAFAAAVRVAVRPVVIGLIVLIAIVTLAGGITIGALVVQANGIIHARTEGRAYTCDGDQFFEIHHNALATANQKVTTKVYDDFAMRLTPTQASAVRDYAATISAKFEATKVPVRGCSSAAIDAYIRRQTGHPTVVKCAADSHGYCKTPPTVTP